MVRKTSRGQSFEQAGFNPEERSIACYNFHPLNDAEPKRQLGEGDILVNGVGLVLTASSDLRTHQLQTEYRVIPSASDDGVAPVTSSLKKTIESWQASKPSVSTVMADYGTQAFDDTSTLAIEGGASHYLHGGFALINNGDRNVSGFFTSRIMELHLGSHAMNRALEYFQNSRSRTPEGRELAAAFSPRNPDVRRQNLATLQVQYIADRIMQAEWATITVEETLGNLAVQSQALVLPTAQANVARA